MYYTYIRIHTYVNSYTIAMVSVTTNKRKETQSKVENSSCR